MLHLADFFIVIVAVFIGVLIAEFVKNLFKGGPSHGESYDPGIYSYRVPTEGFNFRARKLHTSNNGRSLRGIHRKIQKGETKLATYINRMLFHSQHVHMPQNKLFRELRSVRNYFDKSGFALPDRLNERSLYKISKNVFWNLHHYNMERKHKVAHRAIRLLYNHRSELFTTFMDSIKGIK